MPIPYELRVRLAAAAMILLAGAVRPSEAGPTGACCENFFGCSENVAPDECFGVYLGDGSTCEQCTGACCLPDETCVENQTPESCSTVHAGNYEGNFTFCPPTACQRGACCFADETCLDGVNALECESSQGVFQGAATDCDNTVCEPFGGTCCLGFGGCIRATLSDCVEFLGGEFLGEGTDCDPNDPTICTGGCCLADEDCVPSLNMQQCNNQGGSYLGSGTDCAGPSPCSPCTTDQDCGDADVCNGAETCDEQGNCQPGTPPECNDQNSCTDDSCDPLAGCRFTDNAAAGCGACCKISGPCVASTAAGCQFQEAGTFRGEGTSCDEPGICNGACCTGIDTCVSVIFGACAEARGSFFGIGVSCLDADCSQLGACCVPPEGVCFFASQFDCLFVPEAVFLGNRIDCTPDPCFCTDDQQCQDGDLCNGQEFCEGGFCRPGNVIPECDDGNPCTTDFCDPAVGCRFLPNGNPDCGACCLADNCQPANEQLCVNKIGGVYQGDGTTCDPNPCRCSGDAECDDDDPCTVDMCTPEGICEDSPLCPEGVNCDPEGHCDCPPPPGDLNFDETVDLSDFAILVDCFRQPLGAVPPECGCADLNHDGLINVHDFGEFQKNFGR